MGTDPNVFEPRSITIGDLAALIAGIALVLVLPTSQSYWPFPSDFLGPWPRWLPWFFCLRQALGAACVALVPVVLCRRVRYGGLARPAELIVVLAAMPFLADSIETALIRRYHLHQTGQYPLGPGLDGMSVAVFNRWRDRGHWSWEWVLLFSGAAMFVAFVGGRRRAPGWFLTASLAIGWLGAYEACTELFAHWLFPAIRRARGRPLGEATFLLIFSITKSLPRFLLYTVPAAAAFRDVFRSDRAGRSWLETTGLALTLALFLVAESTEGVRLYSVSGGSGSWARETGWRAATLLAAIGLGLFLNRSGRSRHAPSSSSTLNHR